MTRNQRETYIEAEQMDAFAATFHGQQQQRCRLSRASCLCLFACATASVAGEQGKKNLFCTVAFGSCLT